ncbi:hypothetical protein IW261DRAFT_1572421 [Armillaria novae-zelandiae]|uniref:Uncharacterized protein n=1 Tax=Armillaria novae-zelandiae TaxID=153914 RepID=A0AA39U5F6_9AGAR|nr:hypothetical protein IW261DRAFT_1572421 [Armillaria novae-zelandiae]
MGPAQGQALKAVWVIFAASPGNLLLAFFSPTMAPSYIKSTTFHTHEAASFMSSYADLLPGCSLTSLTADSWVCCAFKCWSRLVQSFQHKDLVFSGPIEWLEFQLVLWATLQQIAVDDMRSSGEEYNFLVAKALKCRVTIDLISELHLAQYAAEVAAASAPLSFGGSPLVPGCTSDFPSPCLPSPMPLSLPPLALSHPLATPSPRTLKLPPPSLSSLPFPLVTAAVDDGANKCTHLTSSPPCSTAAQKGKGHVISAGTFLFVFACRSLAMTKDVRKVRVKGGLGEKTPKDAVEVEDPALMPLGLLVPDKDYGDFIGCDSHYFCCSLGDLIGHFMNGGAMRGLLRCWSAMQDYSLLFSWVMCSPANDA